MGSGKATISNEAFLLEIKCIKNKKRERPWEGGMTMPGYIFYLRLL